MGQFEWESSNLHVSYPFEQSGIVGLDAFADALVLDTAHGKRAKLDSLTVSAWSLGNITASVSYEDSSAFFPGTPIMELKSYGQWRVIILSDTNKSVQLVLDGNYALPILVTGPLLFVARVHECDPYAVRSVSVTDGVTDVFHTLYGNIKLTAGYNVQLKTLTRTFTPRAGAASIEASAIPGAGLGVAPSTCAPDLVVRSINSIGPNNNGKFTINGLDCYRCIVPTSGSPDPAVFNPLPGCITVCNDCSECCKCTDYENVYKAMSRLHDKGSNSGLRLARTIDDFSDLKTEIGNQKDQREIPTMDLLLRPTPGYIMGVQVNLLNNTTQGDIDMRIESPHDITDSLVKMLITSPDIDDDGMSEVKVVPTSCYVYNSAIGNPWVRVNPADIILPDPPVFVPDPPEATYTLGLKIEKYIGPPIKAGSFAVGTAYRIKELGDTDWVACGAASGTVGLQFTATTAGSGTGTAILAATKPYYLIKPTQFVTIFFELFWPEAAAPADADSIRVKIMSDLFKPYTLTRVDALIEPFTGEIE